MNLKILNLLTISALLLFSCREEIIPPDNLVENINEPVQINESNSYTFLLNADNFSMDLSVSAFFSSNRTRFNITLIDYESGYATVYVQDAEERIRFQYFIAESVSYHTDVLDGYSPEIITIRTENFSGKIKIEFKRTL